ncbi:MAG TPA: M14 family zinc carboxypeptidase [Flavisolibacter sp.]
MFKRSAGIIIAILCFQFSFAQVQTPDQFLGYPLGSRYTPHWKIIEYYRHVAAAVPGMVKLQEYGKTNEGRTLMVAFVSGTSNISNLENIRKNNLGLARMASGGSTSNAPAIVWLSYNVHGNETSSSEAGMATLYSLVEPGNPHTKQWLQNTVVVIDPCLNPDGRDRYVNWFNSVIGTQYNPSLNAREHREPWPGGRTNHYNHDLNRDWAWQTQVESEQRMKVYHQWMPQVHVDFHEQGINNPYYFAPAAQPYHEVITKWQRDFQFDIGRNHARYFDEKGWLYFTREIFDLLYPSYGDTYPIFNGAIGMTYEQGGGPAGGAAVLTQEGDTLTLLDRIMHHHTTSLSTIEISSLNASKLVNEFHKFFNDANNNGVGEYKSYVIKYSDNDEQRINRLKELLEKNHIRVGAATRNISLKGYSYLTGRDESFSITGSDLVIPANQPKGSLVKVLFEPNTVVVDSNTYDITAWALPYVYGLKAYAVKDKIITNTLPAQPAVNNSSQEDPYAYVFAWSGVNSVRLATELLERGIKLRLSEQAFESGGVAFERGAIIILKTSNHYYGGLWNEVRGLANEMKVKLVPVKTGFVDKGYDFGSSKIRPLLSRRIAVITGEGINSNAAGEVWHYFDKEIEYPVTLINQNDIGRIRWSDYDVVVMPDGNYRFFSDKAQVDAFRNWIQGGGHVVALENAVSQLSKQDWSIKLKKESEDDADEKDQYELLKRYEDRERDFIPNMTPGSIYRVELDNTHPLGFGFPGYYHTLKYDDRIYEFIKEGGWNVGVIKKENQVAGFVGSKLQNRLQDGLLFGVQDIGGGTITYLADNVLFRSFWENGKLMFANAVFLVGQ